MTLSGARAALGSPEIDAAFRLNVTAVVSQRQRRRLPAMPDHLPGRPVMRLRRWAAAARGRTWPPPGGQAAASGGGAAEAAAEAAGVDVQQAGSSSSNGSASSSGNRSLDAAAAAAAASDDSSAVPFPGQHVYISHDENDSDEYDDAGGELAAADLAVVNLDAATSSASGYGSSSEASSGFSSASSAALPSQQTAAGAAGQQQQAQAARQQGPQALLHCRTRVTMAVRVPGPLKVVPNALLGYAGGFRSSLGGACASVCRVENLGMSGVLAMLQAAWLEHTCTHEDALLSPLLAAPLLPRRQPVAAHHSVCHAAQLPGAVGCRLQAVGRHCWHRRQQRPPVGRSCWGALFRCSCGSAGGAAAAAAPACRR